NSLRVNEVNSLHEVIEQLVLITDAHNSPLIALSKTIVWQGNTGQDEPGLGSAAAPTLQNKMIPDNQQSPLTHQAPPASPLKNALGPLLSLIENDSAQNGVSLQSYLTRLTQIRLKLQQIANSNDPLRSAQNLGQHILQGKVSNFGDTLDYSHLLAASLGEALAPFGESLFAQPVRQAWWQVLEPTTVSINQLWRNSIIDEWNNTFTGRYPFADTKHDVSVPLLGRYIRPQNGKIDQFLRNQLAGLLHKEGNQWFTTSLNTDEVALNPQFLAAINELGTIADALFAEGEAGMRFKLMALPSPDIIQTQLTLDGTTMKYFNQLENWQTFHWPGDNRYPKAMLSWSSVRSSSRMLVQYEGSWAVVRLLEMAQIAKLDSSRYQLTWTTPDKLKLTYLLSSDIPRGPLTLLKLRNYRLPDTIFMIPEPATQTEQ
ncbi:MAG: type VI secretion IcmF C-terminal domain-containing protein, partial [Enterobacteriaceae bacterium]